MRKFSIVSSVTPTSKSDDCCSWPPLLVLVGVFGGFGDLGESTFNLFVVVVVVVVGVIEVAVVVVAVVVVAVVAGVGDACVVTTTVLGAALMLLRSPLPLSLASVDIVTLSSVRREERAAKTRARPCPHAHSRCVCV